MVITYFKETEIYTPHFKIYTLTFFYERFVRERIVEGELQVISLIIDGLYIEAIQGYPWKSGIT